MAKYLTSGLVKINSDEQTNDTDIHLRKVETGQPEKKGEAYLVMCYPSSGCIIQDLRSLGPAWHPSFLDTVSAGAPKFAIYCVTCM